MIEYKYEDIVGSILSISDINLVRELILRLSEGDLSVGEKNLLDEVTQFLDGGSIPSPKMYDTLGSFTLISADLLESAIASYLFRCANRKSARELMRLASQVAESGVTKEVKSRVENIISKDVVSDTQYVDVSTRIVEFYNDKKKIGSGLKFGVDAIDEVIGGLSYGSVNTIFAYTGSFKTLSAINIAYNNSYNLGYNILYLSLEVLKQDLYWNILSRHVFSMNSGKFRDIPHQKIRTQSLTPLEEKFLLEEVVPNYLQTSKGKLYIADELDIEDNSVRAMTKLLKQVDDLAISQTGKGLDCVILDQLQLLKYSSSSKFGDEFSVLNMWTSYFRQQCLNFVGRERPIVMIILSQANREGWKRAVKNEGVYDMRAISEANELERASWRIFSIYSDENMKISKEAKIQCLKNRTGQTLYDPVVVFVDPENYLFGDIGKGFNTKLEVSDLNDIFDETFGAYSDIDLLF